MNTSERLKVGRAQEREEHRRVAKDNTVSPGQ